MAVTHERVGVEGSLSCTSDTNLKTCLWVRKKMLQNTESEMVLSQVTGKQSLFPILYVNKEFQIKNLKNTQMTSSEQQSRRTADL